MIAGSRPRAIPVIGPAPEDPRAVPHRVVMRDGVALATDVYLPAGTARELPTVLIRLPYDKSGRYTFMASIAGYLNAYGFAVVVQDVRGKFRSDGERVPFVHEVADGYDTLDWIVDQAWCGGAVGMLGDSYYGFTQWAAVASGHPALKAIVPRVTGSRFMEMLGGRDVPKIPVFEWALHTFAAPGLFADPVLGGRPLGGYDDVAEEARHVVPVVEELGAACDDGLLLARVFPDGVAPAPALKIPALHMGGWWDNLQRAQLDDWAAVQDAPAAEHQFLRMAATDHEDFELREAHEPHADHEVDDDALVAYLPRMLDEPVSFLQHYLTGQPGRWSAPRVGYTVAHGGTRIADRWPPRDVRAVALHLGDGGALLAARPAEASLAEWPHAPEDPVPYLVENEWGQLAELPDESGLHDRPDVLTFTTAAQAASADVVGPVTLRVEVDADAPSTHLIARLLDVEPGGRATLVLEGAAIAETADGPAAVTLRLGDTAYRLLPGHRLRLATSSSCFPLYAVHPGTDESPWRTTRSRAVWHSIRLGSDAGAVLRLPVRGAVGAG